jgi:hypothetical protein
VRASLAAASNQRTWLNTAAMSEKCQTQTYDRHCIREVLI